jgi:hypothetical protein
LAASHLQALNGQTRPSAAVCPIDCLCKPGYLVCHNKNPGVTAGDVVLLAVQFESSWGWLVLLPLYGWLLFLMLGT